jgi:hypothetical protein
MPRPISKQRNPCEGESVPMLQCLSRRTGAPECLRSSSQPRPDLRIEDREVGRLGPLACLCADDQLLGLGDGDAS